jgi:L-gulonate 5-dehydrogenase
MIRAIRINSPRNMEICDVTVPKNPRMNEVLVSVKAAGICGSDYHIYLGTHPIGDYPRVIGHEFVGEIAEVGSAVSGLAPGDHIVANPMISCGTCYACRLGRNNICSSLQVRGVHVDGGFSELVVLPQRSVHKISKHLEWSEAALIEPFTIASQVIWRARITEKDNVLIMGAGTIGLVGLQLVKKIGAKCTVTDIFDSHLELAEKMGADRVINSSKEPVEEIIQEETGGVGMSVVIEAVGLTSLLEEAVKLAAPAARIIVLGFVKDPFRISHFDITIKELEIIGSRLNTNKFPEVVNMFNRNELHPDLLLSHTFHFTEAQKAFDLIEQKPEDVCKVVLMFD